MKRFCHSTIGQLIAFWLCVLIALPAHADISITYLHHDALGSPVAATDEAGDILWTEDYLPYGKKLSNDMDAATEKVGYTGHRYDNQTGLIYAGARMYDPELGRFMGIDPVSALVAGDNPVMFNRYTYGNNNPYKYIDPDGRWVQLVVAAGLFVIDVAFSVGNENEPGDDSIRPVAPGFGIGVGVATIKTGAQIGTHLGAKVFDKAEDVTKGTGKTAKEGIYEFTDTAGKKYCGQSCNIPNRLKQHQKTGKLDSNQSVQTTEVLGGKTAREIAEHKRIQEITGGVPARFSDKVSNKVDPIGPNRSHLLD